MIFLASLLAGAFGAVILAEHAPHHRIGHYANLGIGLAGGAVAAGVISALVTPPASLWAFLLILVFGTLSGAGARLTVAALLKARATRR